MSKMRLSKRELHLLFLSFFVGDRETEKRKKQNGKSQKPYKMCIFKVVIQTWKKWKNGVFSKLTDTICVRKREKRAFSCTLPVLAKNVFGPRAPENYTFFLEKVLFDMGEKVVFTVFLESCVFPKTQFL